MADWTEETPLAARWHSPLDMVGLWLGDEPRPDRVAHTRDIAGNPFRPAVLNPAWRTPVVVSVAQAAYQERADPPGALDPVRLAVLSDALEEAGCTNAAILTHLRSTGPHVRGCWAVDLVLSKS